MNVKMMKIVFWLSMLVMAYLPSLALADISMPPSPSPEFPSSLRDYLGVFGLLVVSMILGMEIIYRIRIKIQNKSRLISEVFRQGARPRIGWKRNAIGCLAWLVVIIIASFIVFPIASCFKHCEIGAVFVYLGIVLLALLVIRRWKEKKNVLPTRREVFCFASSFAFDGICFIVWLVVVVIITACGLIAYCAFSGDPARMVSPPEYCSECGTVLKGCQGSYCLKCLSRRAREFTMITNVESSSVGR